VRSVLLQAPTGFGKTVVAADVMLGTMDRGGVPFFVCHRRELVEQSSLTLTRFGIPHSFIAAGFPYDPRAACFVASIDSLKSDKRLAVVPQPKLMIWDETHHIAAAGWAKVRNHYGESYHLGLSATPRRLDGKGLAAYFEAMVQGPPVAWLIDNGFLAQYRIFSIPGADTSKLHRRAGEFIKAESAAAMDRKVIMGNIGKHWSEYARGRLTIGFAVTVQHSQHIVQAMQAIGIRAAHLDATTKRAERKQILQDLARGRLDMVWNVGLFGEGYDLAANAGLNVQVGCVVDAAPTDSESIWLQRCGRALRPQESRAVILDHAGNAGRHGLPCEPREWTLEHDRKKRNPADRVPMKQCDRCYACHEPAPACPECGYEYPITQRQINEIEGELQELDRKRERKQQQRQAQTLAQLIALGEARGYKPGWARHVWKVRQGRR